MTAPAPAPAPAGTTNTAASTGTPTPVATTNSPTTRASTAAAAASNKKATANHDGNAPSNPQANPSITDLDVLVGRGKGAYLSAGNIKFQQLVNEQLEAYKQAQKNKDKIDITNRIVQEVKNYGGRFLKEDGLHGEVQVIDDRQARIKVAQAMRRRRRIDEHGIDQSSSYHPERRRMRKQQQEQQLQTKNTAAMHRAKAMAEQQKHMQLQYQSHQVADISAARAAATAAAQQHRATKAAAGERQTAEVGDEGQSLFPPGFPIHPSKLGAAMDIPPQHPTNNGTSIAKNNNTKLKSGGDDDIMDAGRALFALSGSPQPGGDDVPSWLQQQRAEFQEKLLQYQANGMPPAEIAALAQQQQHVWAQQQQQEAAMEQAQNPRSPLKKRKNEGTETRVEDSASATPPKKRRSKLSKQEENHEDAKDARKDDPESAEKATAVV